MLCEFQRVIYPPVPSPGSYWKTNSKFGVQFEVESYDEVLVPTKEG